MVARAHQAVGLILLGCLVAACGSSPSAPIVRGSGNVVGSSEQVQSRNQSQTSAVAGRYYTVKRGDTLHSIARRNGVDFQQLARINRLSSPYVLRVGQRLRLDVEHIVDVTPGKPYTVQRGDTLYGIAFALGMDFRELAALNGIAPPYTITVGQTLRTQTSPAGKQTPKKPSTTKTPAPSDRGVQPAPSQSIPTTVTKSATASKPAVKAKPTDGRLSPPKPVSTAPVSSWRWPVAGAVVRRFSANHHKGIDIDGRRGETVRAVAGGTVVYAGTGVKGYGALVIVKHNDVFLSAYGHNDAMLVKEGAQIKPGQAIASMGSSGTDAVKLHLEIRKNGKPIDPLSVLPVRR